MFGMKFPLDLIFLDQNGRVLETIDCLEPWQRSGWVEGARYAVEVPTGTLESSGTRVGDRLVWKQPDSGFLASPSLQELWTSNGDGDSPRDGAEPNEVERIDRTGYQRDARENRR